MADVELVVVPRASARLMGEQGGGYTAASSMGDWLSRLERTVHIREVTGSNPVSPTTFPPG
jgi:hypothetical protein